MPIRPNNASKNEILVTEPIASCHQIGNIHSENSQVIAEAKNRILRKQKNPLRNTLPVQNADSETDILVRSHIGLSSTDISNQDTINASNSIRKVFQQIKNNSHFLISNGSKAHSNELIKTKSSINHNDLIVKLSNSNSCSSSNFICRICHGGESIDDLLTPCRCRGTVALVHLKCLERWLTESNHTSCELCQHRYRIIREPKYSVPWSIVVFLRHPPRHHLSDLLTDLMIFAVYTPSAIGSTYMMLLICEAIVENRIVTTGSISSHILAFSAGFGMAVIDFTYSSWLVFALQKHIHAWREWYNSNAKLTVVLSDNRMKPCRNRITEIAQA